METLGAFGARGELGVLGTLSGAIDPGLGIAVPFAAGEPDAAALGDGDAGIGVAA